MNIENMQVLAQNRKRTKIIHIIDIIKKGKLFILVSFLNSFYPIIFCIIASYISKTGAQDVMGIGYTAVFTLSFSQLAITLSASTIFIIIKLKHEKIVNVEESKNTLDKVMSTALLFAFCVGVIITIIYIASSYLYMFYSTNRPNTLISLTSGMNYVYASSLYVFLICIKDLLLMYVFIMTKNRAIRFEVLFFIFSFVLSGVLGVLTSLGTIGIGLGLSISTVLILLFLIFYIWLYIPFHLIKPYRGILKKRKILRSLIQESVSGISITIFKGLALLVIGLVIFNKLDDFVPLSYQMSRVIWFNFMYAIPFLGVGLSDAIKFYYYYNPNLKPLQGTRIFWILGFCSLLVSAILSYIASVSVIPLSNLYIQNAQYILPMELPPFPKGMPNIPYNQLPPNQFPDLPSTYYQPGVDKEKLLLHYIQNVINEPTQNIVSLEWFQWFNHLNINTKEYIIANPKTFENWLIQYETYTTYNSGVINALINLRSSNAINQPLNVELLNIKFNAKSMVYIGIYGTLSSIWNVLLPSIYTIDKKQKSPYLIMLIYGSLIGFIMAFGIIYSLYVKSPNPFEYMDAWTFPLAIGSSAVFIFILLEWLNRNYKFYKKIRQFI